MVVRDLRHRRRRNRVRARVESRARLAGSLDADRDTPSGYLCRTVHPNAAVRTRLRVRPVRSGLRHGRADRSRRGRTWRRSARARATRDGGLVSCTQVGSQRRYSANRSSPIFAELKSIIDKSRRGRDPSGRTRPRSSQHHVRHPLRSVAKETDGAGSDIDVLVVSDTLALEDVFAALEPAEKRLGRTVGPTLSTATEFRKRRRTPFLSKVATGARHAAARSQGRVIARVAARASRPRSARPAAALVRRAAENRSSRSPTSASCNQPTARVSAHVCARSSCSSSSH